MVNLLTENRSAYSAFHIGDLFEAGIVLTGSEVKAVRNRRVRLTGSFVKITGREAYVHNLKIDRYRHTTDHNYDPRRPRKLLLQSREIAYLGGRASQKGVTLLPLEVYIKNNLIKLKIGIALPKKKYDHRRELRERTLQRDIDQELKEHLSPKY